MKIPRWTHTLQAEWIGRLGMFGDRYAVDLRFRGCK